jgi:hypothetical protein
MIATIIVIALIIAYSVFVIINYLKSQKKAKLQGIQKGCYACAAFKQGKCPSHENHKTCSGSCSKNKN